MPPTIVSPAACEVRAVIRFLSAKGVKPIDIHREICEVYGQNIMSDGMVRKWVRAFKDGRTNVHDEERSGRPSVVNEDLVQKVDEKSSCRAVLTSDANLVAITAAINSNLGIVTDCTVTLRSHSVRKNTHPAYDDWLASLKT
ncbi:hypothetical protein ACJJTC_001314 [Scirpophaga incertulas]